MKHPQRNKHRSAGRRPAFVGGLQPDSQGRVAGGFHCNACGEDRTRVGGAHESEPFPPMAVCRLCYERLQRDEAFRNGVATRMRAAAPAELANWLSERLNRPVEDLMRAFASSCEPADWDVALGLPAASCDAAISRISAIGLVIGAEAARQIPRHVRDAVIATAQEVAPLLGIAAQELAERMLSHPDVEQLMSEAIVMHQREIHTTRRH